MLRTPKVVWALLLSCALGHLILAPKIQAQGDHRLVWRSLSTPHFEIHYHEPLGLLAREYAARAEGINTRLEKALGLSLQQRVHLVIADDDDDANGFAGPLPYNSIRLRAAAPADMSPLSDYDHWPTTLLTHEHTHILHLEHASGLPRLVQAIFGRLYTPQQYLPGWLVEGLAVVEESAYTTAGRGRSTLFDMYLRADALSEALLDIDWISFDGEPWPHGHVRYLYGHAFMQYIVDRFGQRALGRMIEEYGKRLIPYGINRALKRATGHTFVELYATFLADLREKARATQREVRARGLVEGERLTFHGELSRAPRFWDEHTVVYSVADARNVPDIRALDLKRASVRRVKRLPTAAHLSPARARGHIVYSNTAFFRGSYAFDELYEVPYAGGRARKLTHGLRAREPDVAPDGRRVAFVTQAAGTSHLRVAELSDVPGTERILVRSQRLGQIYTPRWSPDGRTIAYSAWTRGGFRDIWLVNVRTGVRTRVTFDRALDRTPAFSPDGKTLYFSSDRTGIANLYAYALATGRLSQVTNVVTGAFQPDVAPDGQSLVYVGYGEKGFDLYRLALSEAAHRPAPPCRLRRAGAAPDPEPLVQPSRAYSPWPTLYPRAYELSTDDVGQGTRATLLTSGADVVGFHSWSMFLTQDLNQNARSAELAYAYRRPRFPVFLSGSVQRGQRSDFIANDTRRTWDARVWRLSVGSSFGFPRPLASFNLRGEYAVGRLDALSVFRFDPDPNFPPPSFPDPGIDARTTWTISHSSTRRQAFNISTSWGHQLSLATTLRDRWIGSRERHVGFTFRALGYHRFDFRESVLALAYTGAFRSAAAVGGYPARIAPLVDALLGTQGFPAEYARLRGYPERRGDHMHVMQLEYRLLLARINRGVSSLPLFARRIHAAVFTDAGDAYRGRFDVTRLGVSAGAELRFDWATGYTESFTLRGGIARGLTNDGELQWYTTLSQPF